MKDGGQPAFHTLSITDPGDQETADSYCHTHRIHHVGKQRLLINHRKAEVSDAAMYFISNRLRWQALGITRIRRHRWPVDVSHEARQADGLDQDQGRDVQAISRPIALVAVTSSLRRAAHHETVLLHTRQRPIETELDDSAGLWRRHPPVQALWALPTLIATGVSRGQTLSNLIHSIVAVLCS